MRPDRSPRLTVTHHRRSTRRRLAAFALVVAVLALTLPGRPLVAPAVARAQSAVPLNDRLGLNFVSSAEIPNIPAARYGRALDAGIRWNRWPIYWDQIDRHGGYGLVDANVVRDRDFGLEEAAILIGTPERFGTVGRTGPAPRVGQRPAGDLAYRAPGDAPLGAGPPVNLYLPVFLPDGRINPENYWAAYVYQTVLRYRPDGELSRERGWEDGWGIRYWEIWNEADSPGFWSGSLQDYYQLLKVGYQAVKTADPEATVLVAGLAYWVNSGWFPQLLDEMERDPDQATRTANRSYFDILPLHWYSQPSLLYDQTLAFRRLLEERGLGDRPIWVNETNVPVWGDPAFPEHAGCGGYLHSATALEQANFVLQAIPYAMAAGVERIFLFQLYDDGNGEAYGLIRNNGEPRPAYTALQTAARLYRDARTVVRDTTGPVERIQFWGASLDGTPARVAVAWARDADARTTSLLAVNAPATLLPWRRTAGDAGTANDRYLFSVPRATARDDCEDPNSRYIIGGDPSLVVEPLPPDAAAPTTVFPPLPGAVCELAILRWRATDSGWGVMDYDVEVRDVTNAADAPWQAWLTRTRQTSAAYVGQPGHRYAFRVRARDFAGNAEPFGDGEARTTVMACPPHLPGGGLIRNASFEEPADGGGAPGWDFGGSTPPRLVNDAHGGGWALALGEGFVGRPDPPFNGGGDSVASQPVTVPADAPLPELRYRYAVESDAPLPTSPDPQTWASRLTVVVVDAAGHANTVAAYGTPADWSPGSADLAPWRGQTVTVRFVLWQSSAAYTTVARLDDVSAWADRRHIPVVDPERLPPALKPGRAAWRVDREP